MRGSLSAALLRWYRRCARDLPWRRTRDPYAVWVAEVMLQQTRVETVVPYFERWMRRFPDIHSLAAAPRDEVLRFWEGLGYYSRAHNLQRAATIVVHEHGGRLPASPEALERLPGVGRYTAAAIAAIAFDIDAIALDGNQRRVLTRLFDLALDPRRPQAERVLRSRASGFVPRRRAAAFNQALMDLGSTICRPRRPRCGECPIARHCLARARGTQSRRPFRPSRQAVPHYRVTAAVLRCGRRVLIAQRPEGTLLGGLWEFPGGKQKRGEALEACLRRELQEELGVTVRVGERLGVFRHAYSHFRVTVYAYECALARGEPRAREHSCLRWAAVQALSRFPMGKVDRAIARMLASGS